MRELILCLLLFSTMVEDRKINIGGVNRGSSAARTNSGGYQPHNSGSFGHQQGGGLSHANYPPAGGFYPQSGANSPHQGGWHPQSNNYHPSPLGGYNQPGFQQSKFNPGTGPGSVSKGNTFKKALIGGALGVGAGLVTYELGKAILNSASSPVHVNGQPYYFGDQNYQPKSGYFMCSMPLEELAKQAEAIPSATESPAATKDEEGNTVLPPVSTTMSPEKFFATVQFKDGTRPKSLTWSCKTGSEVCCGTECCPAPQVAAAAPSHSKRISWMGIIFGILAGLLLLTCCCCCLAYKLCRSAFDMCLPSRNTNSAPEVVYTESAATGYDNTHGTGMQTQQIPSYPNFHQDGYPPTHGYNYPSHPYGGGPQYQQQQQYY